MALAADIPAVTGWSITRDRYSKYESGSLPFGREVLAHFIDYWTAKRGEPCAPDFTPPVPMRDPMDRIADALERIAQDLAGLRSDIAGQSGATIGAVQSLEARLTASLEGMRVAP